MTDNSGHYLLGSTVKEALGMVIRSHHELHDIVMTLQSRILKLEIESNCQHVFHRREYGFACINCNKQKGF